jgi:glycerol-3-phosphate dehydrogenase subunit C
LVAELNIQVKARKRKGLIEWLRDQALSRPDTIGKFFGPIATLFNVILSLKGMRWFLDHILGIAKGAPLPTLSTSRYNPETTTSPPLSTSPSHLTQVVFFHGCNIEYYEPAFGQLLETLLAQLNIVVLHPKQSCCGLPLQSNGEFRAARSKAEYNIRQMAPFVSQGLPILSPASSCTYTLKHDYRVVLGVHNEKADLVADHTYDIFEYLWLECFSEVIKSIEKPIRAKAVYHPPCQLRSHGVGFPALRILQQIPEFDVHLSNVDCCGIAGTYGLKKERFGTAQAIGSDLFDQIHKAQPDFVLTDSETCRWWISHRTGFPTYHPAEILAWSMGIQTIERRDVVDLHPS